VWAGRPRRALSELRRKARRGRQGAKRRRPGFGGNDTAPFPEPPPPLPRATHVGHDGRLQARPLQAECEGLGHLRAASSRVSGRPTCQSPSAAAPARGAARPRPAGTAAEARSGPPSRCTGAKRSGAEERLQTCFFSFFFVPIGCGLLARRSSALFTQLMSCPGACRLALRRCRLALTHAFASAELGADGGPSAEPPADLPPSEAACAELRALLQQAGELLTRGKARARPVQCFPPSADSPPWAGAQRPRGAAGGDAAHAGAGPGVREGRGGAPAGGVQGGGARSGPAGAPPEAEPQPRRRVSRGVCTPPRARLDLPRSRRAPAVSALRHARYA